MIQRSAQVEGRVLLESEFIQKKDFISFPSDKQGFGRLAWRRPAVEKWIEILFGIDAQDKGPYCAAVVLFVEDGDQDRQIDAPVIFIPVEILKGHLFRAQGFGSAKNQMAVR